MDRLTWIMTRQTDLMFLSFLSFVINALLVFGSARATRYPVIAVDFKTRTSSRKLIGHLSSQQTDMIITGQIQHDSYLSYIYKLTWRLCHFCLSWSTRYWYLAVQGPPDIQWLQLILKLTPRHKNSSVIWALNRLIWLISRQTDMLVACIRLVFEVSENQNTNARTGMISSYWM